MDSAFSAVAEKLRSGRRLDAADGEVLFATSDVHALGALADRVRRARHGANTYYNVNRHINYTNRCVLACRFCGFRRAPTDAGAHDIPIDQIAALARQTAEAGGTEVHITGGLHPHWKIDYYERMLRAIRSAAPHLHVKAFTAVEIAHFADLSGLSVEQALRRLIDCGLDSMPGGGAEIFDSRGQAETFGHKMGAEAWFNVHRTAHRLGLRTNATMLYGHVETPAERVGHLIRLRALQDETSGFQAFVPLSFLPAGTALSHLPGPTGLTDLRTVAAARLLLDNFDHVKTFWIMQTIQLSQMAIAFGADDIDGTVLRYEIVTPGGSPHQHMTADQLRQVVAEAGYRPVERDSLYRGVRRGQGDGRQGR